MSKKELIELVEPINGFKNSEIALCKHLQKDSSIVFYAGLKCPSLKNKEIKKCLFERENTTNFLISDLEDNDNIDFLNSKPEKIKLKKFSKDFFDISYFPKDFKHEWWSEFTISKDEVQYFYPHDPTKKSNDHIHIGFKLIKHSEEHALLIEEIYRYWSEIWNEIENGKINPPVKLNFLEKIINNHFYRINEDYLKETYRGKWILIMKGELYEKTFDDYISLLEELGKFKKDPDPFLLSTHKICWEMVDDEEKMGGIF